MNMTLPIMAYEFYFVARVACLYTVDTYGITICCITCSTSIEVVHWKACIAGYLVQTLATGYSFLYHILIAEDFIV